MPGLSLIVQASIAHKAIDDWAGGRKHEEAAGRPGSISAPIPSAIAFLPPPSTVYRPSASTKNAGAGARTQGARSKGAQEGLGNGVRKALPGLGLNFV
jgi:hypothetical protein